MWQVWDQTPGSGPGLVNSSIIPGADIRKQQTKNSGAKQPN